MTRQTILPYTSVRKRTGGQPTTVHMVPQETNHFGLYGIVRRPVNQTSSVSPYVCMAHPDRGTTTVYTVPLSQIVWDVSSLVALRLRTQNGRHSSCPDQVDEEDSQDVNGVTLLEAPKEQTKRTTTVVTT